MSGLVPVATKLDLERAQSMREDLNWLPRSFQWVRWSVAGAVWAGVGTATIAFIAATHAHFIYIGKGGFGLIAGGYYAGDRAARALLRKRLARLAGGQIDMLKLRETDDGELVHVRGKIRATQTLPPSAGVYDDGRPAVYRRRHIRMDLLEFVQEQAVDFQVVADDGQRATVRVDHSRFVADPPKNKAMQRLTLAEVQALSPTFLGKGAVKAVWQARKRLERGKKSSAMGGSVCLYDGDEVALVGYKSRTVDPTVSDRLQRDIPYATVLQGGRELPLIITLAGPRQLGAGPRVDAIATRETPALPASDVAPPTSTNAAEPDDAS